jgi:fumarate hydratase subunit alpha
MQFKTVSKEVFKSCLGEQLVYANFNLREDIARYLNDLRYGVCRMEEKRVVDVFIENAGIARSENRALCQDTGYVQVYMSVGNRVFLDFDIQQTVNEVVSEVYKKFALRQSLADPVTRVNTRDNTPAFIDTEIVEGDTLDVWIMIKGGGSENVSGAGLLLPTAAMEDVSKWAVGVIAQAGSKACPPYLIGVCVGGTLAKAVSVSKRLLLEYIDQNTMNKVENEISVSILKNANKLSVGFQGLKFGDTIIAAKVKTIPCHIATLPVAVSIGCNSIRQGYFRI